jgi:aminoglycoside phosphotransferase (APT) family kinase protein
MSGAGPSWRLGVKPTDVGLERLRGALGLKDRVRVVRRLAGGIGAATHLVRSGNQYVVVKQYPRDRRERVAREWDGLNYATANDLPAPMPLAVDADGAWFGLPTLAMSLVPGTPDLEARDLEAFVAEVTDLLCRVHAVDVHAEPPSFHRPSRVARWTRPHNLPDGLLPAELIEKVMSRIDELVAVAAPEEPVLNHGDLHPGNLLWHDKRIAGLVDWSHIQIGTRSAEVAYFRIELATLVEPSAADLLLDRYEQRSGTHAANQQLSDLLHVYAGHHWAHTWLEGWIEQGRAGLDLAEVSRRLALVADHVLATSWR